MHERVLPLPAASQGLPVVAGPFGPGTQLRRDLGACRFARWESAGHRAARRRSETVEPRRWKSRPHHLAACQGQERGAPRQHQGLVLRRRRPAVGGRRSPRFRSAEVGSAEGRGLRRAGHSSPGVDHQDTRMPLLDAGGRRAGACRAVRSAAVADARLDAVVRRSLRRGRWAHAEHHVARSFAGRQIARARRSRHGCGDHRRRTSAAGGQGPHRPADRLGPGAEPASRPAEFAGRPDGGGVLAERRQRGNGDRRRRGRPAPAGPGSAAAGDVGASRLRLRVAFFERRSPAGQRRR